MNDQVIGMMHLFINNKRVEVQSTNLRSNTTIIAGASDSIECSKCQAPKATAMALKTNAKHPNSVP
jgi:hypothetical protein